MSTMNKLGYKKELRDIEKYGISLPIIPEDHLQLQLVFEID
jgi:hypothetical protein